MAMSWGMCQGANSNIVPKANASIRSPPCTERNHHHPNQPSARYLWVGGVHGMTVRQLAEIFVPYGAPEVLPPPAADAPGQVQQATASAPNEQEPGPPLSAPDTPHQQQQQQQDQQQQGLALNEHQQLHVGGGQVAEDAWLTSHAFLRFESEGDAAAALAAVPRNAPWPAAGGRKLVANYADLRRDKVRLTYGTCRTLSIGTRRWVGGKVGWTGDGAALRCPLPVQCNPCGGSAAAETDCRTYTHGLLLLFCRSGRCPGRWPPAARSWAYLGCPWCTSS